MASPSNPSVRFTALEDPISIKIQKGTKNIPKRYKKFGIETYQQCRSKKSCNNIWYIPYKESIFRDSGPFYKAVAKIISIDYNNDE